MTFIDLEREDRGKRLAGPKRISRPAAQSRYSDVWPNCLCKISETEIIESAIKNRLSVVLWEAVRAVAVSIGMVIALIALLDVFAIR